MYCDQRSSQTLCMSVVTQREELLNKRNVTHELDGCGKVAPTLGVRQIGKPTEWM